MRSQKPLWQAARAAAVRRRRGLTVGSSSVKAAADRQQTRDGPRRRPDSKLDLARRPRFARTPNLGVREPRRFKN